MFSNPLPVPNQTRTTRRFRPWQFHDSPLKADCKSIPSRQFSHVCSENIHASAHFSGRIMSLPRTLALYACSILAAVLMVVICWPAYRYSGDARPGFNYATLWYEQRPVPPLIIADIVSGLVFIRIHIYVYSSRCFFNFKLRVN